MSFKDLKTPYVIAMHTFRIGYNIKSLALSPKSCSAYCKFFCVSSSSCSFRYLGYHIWISRLFNVHLSFNNLDINRAKFGRFYGIMIKSALF